MEAYVTLVATDSYAAGALVLAHRLRDHGTKRDIVCLVTPEISANVRNHLARVCVLVPVDTLRSSDAANLAILGRPELDITFTKIHVWRLAQYTKLVFLDADTLPLRNIDELFERPAFAAAPDAGWPDCFNSGVFVTEPSDATFANLQELAGTLGSFDGGDQGLLNSYFGDWATGSPLQRLPFIYNATPTTQYSYAPAHYHFGHNIAIAHFIGLDKPWKWQRFADGKILPRGDSWQGLSDLVQCWWDTWNLHYGQIDPHTLFSLTPSSALDGSYHRNPIELFDISGLNAWDTPRIESNLRDSPKESRQYSPMPPLSGVTLGRPHWLPEEDYQADDIHMATHHHEPNQEHGAFASEDDAPDAVAASDVSSVEESTYSKEDGGLQYTMIEWNPAHQPPPDNKVSASDLPDLSGFVNAWDLPMDKQPVWIAPEPQHTFHHHFTAGERVSHAFPWEASTETAHPPSQEDTENRSPAPETDDYILEQMNKMVDDLEATTLGDQDNSQEEDHDVGNKYAMDAIVATPSPGRSPFLSFFDDEQLDNDWSARDMIPIPLKPTSKLSLGSPRSATPKSPRSPRSPRRFLFEGAPLQSSRLYAHEQISFSKKTPYSSVAATPVAEKGAYFDSEELTFTVDETAHQTGTVHNFDFLSSTDYSFDKPLTTLRREHRGQPSAERATNQHPYHQDQESQWDTNMALENLKRMSETMIMTKLLETATGEPKMDIPLALESTTQSPEEPVVGDTWTKADLLSTPHTSLSLVEPTTAAATLLEVELDLSKSDLLQRRSQKVSAPTPVADIVTAKEELDTRHSTDHAERNDGQVEAGDTSGMSEAPFAAYFDVSVIQAAQEKLQALMNPEKRDKAHATIENVSLPQPLDRAVVDSVVGNADQDAVFGGTVDQIRADLGVLDIQMPEQTQAPRQVASNDATQLPETTADTLVISTAIDVQQDGDDAPSSPVITAIIQESTSYDSVTEREHTTVLHDLYAERIELQETMDNVTMQQEESTPSREFAEKMDQGSDAQVMPMEVESVQVPGEDDLSTERVEQEEIGIEDVSMYQAQLQASTPEEQSTGEVKWRETSSTKEEHVQETTPLREEHVQETIASPASITRQLTDTVQAKGLEDIHETAHMAPGERSTSATSISINEPEETVHESTRRESHSRSSTVVTSTTATTTVATSTTGNLYTRKEALDKDDNTDVAETEVVYLSSESEDESALQAPATSIELLSEDEDTEPITLGRSTWSRITIWVSDDEDETS